eukprot:scaffold108631_cov63-Phaeocystis_antarctica.AAC.3
MRGWLGTRGGVQQPVASREEERVEQDFLALAEVVALVPLAEGHVGLVAQHLPHEAQRAPRPLLAHLLQKGGRVGRDEDPCLRVCGEEGPHVRLVLLRRHLAAGARRLQVLALVGAAQMHAQHRRLSAPLTEELLRQPVDLGEQRWLQPQVRGDEPRALAPVPRVPGRIVGERLVVAWLRLRVTSAVVVGAHRPWELAVDPLTLLARQHWRLLLRRLAVADREEVVLEGIGPVGRIVKGSASREADARVLALRVHAPHDPWLARVHLAKLDLVEREH